MKDVKCSVKTDSDKKRLKEDWNLKRMKTRDIITFWVETREMLQAMKLEDRQPTTSRKSFDLGSFRVKQMEISQALANLEDMEFLWILYNYGYGYSERETILKISRETKSEVHRTSFKRKEKGIIEKLYQEFWKRGLVAKSPQILCPSHGFLQDQPKVKSNSFRRRELTV